MIGRIAATVGFARPLVAGLAALLLLIVPAILSPYWTSVVTEMLIFGLFAASLNILTGYMGFPSLGHAAFFGTGSYTLTIMLLRYGLGQGVSALIAIAVVVLLSAILAPLTLRTRGISFLFVTLAVAQSLWAIVWKWKSMTNGDDGISGIPRPDLGLSWWSLTGAGGFYYFVLAVFVLSIAALYIIIKSPFGRTLVGIRDSESRMRMVGYNVWLHAFIASVFAGLFAGVAGVLFAWYNQFISPGQLGIVLSTEGLLMVILGGGGTIVGPLLGAAAIVLLKHSVSMFFSHWPLVLGPIYIAAIIFMPRGIASLFGRRWRI